MLARFFDHTEQSGLYDSDYTIRTIQSGLWRVVTFGGNCGLMEMMAGILVTAHRPNSQAVIRCYAQPWGSRLS